MNLAQLQDLQVYFVGIGGIGMSGIAQVLVDEGACVSGSDICENANVLRLQKHGIQVYKGHEGDRIADKDIVVVSSDISRENPEFAAALQKNIKIMHRAEMLGYLMKSKKGIAISGTHGKTTTTALVGHFLEAAGVDPTIVNGGIINAYNSNAKQGHGEWFVAEADESDGSFLTLPAHIAVITNIDPEHMTHYGSIENLYDSFKQFIRQLPQEGVGILGIDHPVVYQLWKELQSEKQLISYGFHLEAEVQCTDVTSLPQGMNINIKIDDKKYQDIHLPLYGHHNAANAMAAIAVAKAINLSDVDYKTAFSSFKGVQRRFTFVEDVNGVVIIDDYGHHPVEIQATLNAARPIVKGKLIAVVQPHRYTRLANHFSEFAASCEAADKVILLPVYSAGEKPIEGISHKALQEAMGEDVMTCNSNEDLAQLLKSIACSGDMVVCLGAGDVSSIARALPEQLRKLDLKQQVKVG